MFKKFIKKKNLINWKSEIKIFNKFSKAKNKTNFASSRFSVSKERRKIPQKFYSKNLSKISNSTAYRRRSGITGSRNLSTIELGQLRAQHRALANDTQQINQSLSSRSNSSRDTNHAHKNLAT